MVKVQDSSGAALTDFTATLTASGASPVSTTCPADSVCGLGTVALRLNDSGTQLLEVTAGGRSASKSFTPVFTTSRGSDGCPGCPVANVGITVQ